MVQDEKDQQESTKPDDGKKINDNVAAAKQETKKNDPKSN